MEFLGTTCTLRASPKGLRVQGFRGMENRRTLKSSKFPGWLLHSPRYGFAGLYGFVLLSGDPPAKAGFRAKGAVDMYIIYIYMPLHGSLMEEVRVYGVGLRTSFV